MSEKENPVAEIIMRCWQDEAFKKRLMAAPAATLKAEGVDVPEGMTLNVVEDTNRVRHLVIPPRPTELSDAALASIEGGLLIEWMVGCLLKMGKNAV